MTLFMFDGAAVKKIHFKGKLLQYIDVIVTVDINNAMLSADWRAFTAKLLVTRWRPLRACETLCTV